MAFSDKKQFTASTVCAVAGVDPAIFRAWRNRNGLFPSSKEAGGRRWNYYSVVDACVVRTVATLVKTGYGATEAAWFAHNTAEQAFKTMLADQPFSPLVVIYTDPDDEGRISDVVFAHRHDSLAVISEKAGGKMEVGTIVDLMAIAMKVLKSIAALKPGGVLSPSESRRLAAETAAAILKPPAEGEGDPDGDA